MATTKTCTRCNGSGKHSFNLKDGDVCYKCSGAGVVAVTSKGAKVKATSTLRKAQIGDTIEQVNIYEIISIEDVVDPKAGSCDLADILNHRVYNQRLIGKNIISGKVAKFYRYVS
jgi:hypothetical protein